MKIHLPFNILLPTTYWSRINADGDWIMTSYYRTEEMSSSRAMDFNTLAKHPKATTYNNKAKSKSEFLAFSYLQCLHRHDLVTGHTQVISK